MKYEWREGPNFTDNWPAVASGDSLDDLAAAIVRYDIEQTPTKELAGWLTGAYEWNGDGLLYCNGVPANDEDHDRLSVVVGQIYKAVAPENVNVVLQRYLARRVRCVARSLEWRLRFVTGKGE